MKKNITRIVLAICIVLWLLLIFAFSNQNAEVSGGESQKILGAVLKFITGKELSDFKVETLVVLSFTIRKLAHFTEYFILSLFSMGFLLTFSKPKMLFKTLINTGFCYIAAALDEFHQTFIDGRSGQFVDTLIDVSGAIVACLILILIISKIKKRKKKV